MEIVLTDSETRILGCLIEKEMATPEYYPLTLNSLVAACNQKSNRDPVVAYDETTVLNGLDGLLANRLVRQSNAARVPKYEQIFSDGLKLVPREKAILCVLMLRGPQTVGEIRGRTERLYSFADLEEVEQTLTSLEENGMVHKHARQPGRKESRYAHLLQGAAEAEPVPARPETVIVRTRSETSADLQAQVDVLREELEALKEEFATFRSQFE